MIGDEKVVLYGMIIAILGFLAFDYKERKPWQKWVFGMLYNLFGFIFMMIAGFTYQSTSDLNNALYIYAVGISFSTLGFLAIVDVIVRYLEGIREIIMKRIEKEHEQEIDRTW